jgi:hypothetical protein
MRPQLAAALRAPAGLIAHNVLMKWFQKVNPSQHRQFVVYYY